MSSQRFVALDLGAESGRAIAGTLENQKLSLDLLHRFVNGPVRVIDHIYWPVLAIFRELLTGLNLYSKKYGKELDGIGVDSWGVDFALLAENGQLLSNPFHYRDSRTDKIPDEVFKIISRQEVYQQTGIQVMSINSLYQLYCYQQEMPELLAQARRLLFIPDLFTYFLTGEMSNEYTIATTSQFYDTAKGSWATGILEQLRLPTHIFAEVTAPGTVTGTLMDSLAKEVNIKPTVVIAPGSHDTASAIAAVPAKGEGWCYISSGTWSLMGVEVSKPVITRRSSELNFTNEGGVDGTIRLLKNIMGMWLIQELRREWSRQGEEIDYASLADLAEKAESFRTLLNPDYQTFASPGNMAGKIAEFCQKTEQPVPRDKGEFIRAVLESLALCYRQTLLNLEELSAKKISCIHIVGGGSQNKRLNQLTANACGCKVIAGPVEATAAGNILLQAIAVGNVGSINEARQIVSNSFVLEEFTPVVNSAWDNQFSRFQDICSG